MQKELKTLFNLLLQNDSRCYYKMNSAAATYECCCSCIHNPVVVTKITLLLNYKFSLQNKRHKDRKPTQSELTTRQKPRTDTEWEPTTNKKRHKIRANKQYMTTNTAANEKQGESHCPRHKSKSRHLPSTNWSIIARDDDWPRERENDQTKQRQALPTHWHKKTTKAESWQWQLLTRIYQELLGTKLSKRQERGVRATAMLKIYRWAKNELTN